MTEKRKALGKGLESLLADAGTDITKTTVPLNVTSEIPINEIESNPFQPRENFDDANLDELIQSIKIHGVIQPVTVRKLGYGKYQLISGERRVRASIRAEKKTIPAYVRVADDQGMLEMSLTENLLREDLNPIETAISFRRLIEECNQTQEVVANRIGKNRSSIANYMRLLKLPEEIQLALKERRLNMGQARTILGVEDQQIQIDIYHRIIENDLSVRQVEEIVKELKGNKKEGRKLREPRSTSNNAYYDSFAERLSDYYNTTVRIRSKSNGKGEIVISFNNTDELKRITSIVNI